MSKIEFLQEALGMLVRRVLNGGPMHGWGIAAGIGPLSKEVRQVEEGSIYPALYRMRRRGRIKTEWAQSENNWRARFYELTKEGRKHLAAEAKGRSRRCAAVVAVMVGLCLPCICPAKSHRIWSDAFHRVWGNVIVATDMTPAGRNLPPPTPEHPVYYVGESLGAELGSIPGDRLPDKKQMNLLVARVLAKQGYLDARPGAHEPSLFLVLQWAYLPIPSLRFVGYNPKYDHPIHPFEVEIMYDTVGASDSLEPHPCYGIVITAFEFKSAHTQHPIACWETRITLPAVGKSMAMALPTMIMAAGPAIGRETTTLPFIGDADAMPQGHVTFGELKFVGYEDKTAPASKGAEPANLRMTDQTGSAGASETKER